MTEHPRTIRFNKITLQGDRQMSTTRRTFLKSTLATAAATGLPWHEALAATELKLHSFVPPRHSIWANVLTPWTKEVAAQSKNELTIRMFPAMQLGGKPPELYRQMVQGISDIVFTLPGYTSGDFPMMALTELPGTAKSADDGTKKLWRHFDKFLSREFKDAKIIMLWNSDTASIMSKSKPVRSVEDLKGMKIRTPSAAQSAQLEHLGATPISMPVTQIYNSLDRGVIDASMIPMSAAIDFKLIEVAKYFTINAPLGRSPFLVSLQKKKYDSLPANLRKVIDDTSGLKLSLQGAKTYDTRNDEAIAAVKKAADRELITLTDKQHDEFVKAFRSLIQKKAAEGDKAGLPASGLIGAYGLLS
jgi:TRAP-type C4-dicarboxylate transport system substrate-binding protein